MLTLTGKLSAETREVNIAVDGGAFTATVKVLTRAEVDAFEAERKAARAEAVKEGFALLGAAFGEDERTRLIAVTEQEIEAMQRRVWSEASEADRAGKFFAIEYPAGQRRQDALRFVAFNAAARAGKTLAFRAATERFLCATVLKIDGLSDGADSGTASPVTAMTPAVAAGMMNTAVMLDGAARMLGDVLADAALAAQYLTAHEKKA